LAPSPHKGAEEDDDDDDSKKTKKAKGMKALADTFTRALEGV
jgi:hypothetical protein